MQINVLFHILLPTLRFGVQIARMEIKQLRARMGWCQSELALKLSVDVEVIQSWERGDTVPSDAQRKLLDNLFIKSELSTLDMLNSASHDAENSHS